MMKNIDLLVGEHCPELLCGICQDILDDPIQVHCPEDHLFCSHCIQKHMETEMSCPLCFTPLDKNSFQQSKFAQRQISRLRIHCPNLNIGCPWQGLLSDNHLEKCEYIPVTCPNTEKGCTEKGLSNVNIKQHMEQCPYQLLTCPNNMPLCQPFFRKDLPKHEEECHSYPCPYVHEGCPFISTRDKVKIHCEGYCGRLHKSIDNLTEEVSRLNKIIQDLSLATEIKMTSTPNNKTKKTEGDPDASMNEMSLFHEMFNTDLFESLDLNSDGQDYLLPSTQPKQSLERQDYLLPSTEQPMSKLLDINSFDFFNAFPTDNLNGILSDAPSPQPLEFIPPTTVPKRTTHGKKIRYSKNVRLAHGAMRMARERTASTPPDETKFSINKWINSDEIKIKKEKKKIPVNNKPELPKQEPSSGHKKRPMFILASSYLSNYSKNSP